MTLNRCEKCRNSRGGEQKACEMLKIFMNLEAIVNCTRFFLSIENRSAIPQTDNVNI